MRKRMSDHITPVLHELHWLPIKYRYRFKIATFAYRHFDGSLPSYLSECLNSRECSREVRSNTINRLHPPRKPNLKTVGGRSFSQIAPKIWNSLPTDLKTVESLPLFKRKLKTHFFKEHFGWRFLDSSIVKLMWTGLCLMVVDVVCGNCCCWKTVWCFLLSDVWVRNEFSFLIWFCAI